MLANQQNASDNINTLFDQVWQENRYCWKCDHFIGSNGRPFNPSCIANYCDDFDCAADDPEQCPGVRDALGLV